MATESNVSSRRKKFALGFIAVLLLITLPIFTIHFREMYEAEKVYTAFNADWIANDYPQALTLVTPGLDPESAHKSFLELFKLMESRAGHLRTFKSSGINTEENASGSLATIHAHLVFENGEANFIYVLKKTKDRWYIDKIDQE